MENFLMHYDSVSGEILGFYLPSVHGEDIPEPTREINVDKYQFYMSNNGKYKIDTTTFEDILITKSLDEIKNEKLNEVQKAYNETLENGFSFDINGTSVVFRYTLSDQMKFVQLYMDKTLNLISYPIPIPAKDGSIVNFNEEQLNQLIQAIHNFAWLSQNKYHELLNVVQATTTIDEANALKLSFNE